MVHLLFTDQINSQDSQYLESNLQHVQDPFNGHPLVITITNYRKMGEKVGVRCYCAELPGDDALLMEENIQEFVNYIESYCNDAILLKEQDSQTLEIPEAKITRFQQLKQLILKRY